MWVVGTLILLAIGAVLIAAIGRTPRAAPSPPLWDVTGLGGTYIGVVGTLAGFSVASATFIAGLSSARGSPTYAATVGMLLISFLTLMGSAMMYGATPAFPASDDESGPMFQALSQVFADASYFLGLALGWLALRPLLVMIELPALADVFTWLLLAAVAVGSARLSVFIYRLTTANGLACAAIPVLGIGLPAVYWLVADRFWPALWPASDTALRLTFLAFAVASVGFLHQTAILLVHGNPRAQQVVRRNGNRVALMFLQMTSIVIALVWFAVATS